MSEFDFGGHVKHIEDAIATPMPECDGGTLTDSELESKGLIKTTAFVRTKRSKNALRIERHKKLKLEKGLGQVNVEIPTASKKVFKELAKKVASGEVGQEAIEQLTTEKKALPGKGINLAKKAAQILSHGGLKAYVLAAMLRLM